MTWWLKIIAKILLSKLPISYRSWKKLHLFVHGDMEKPAKALEIFLEHANTACVLTDSKAKSISFIKNDSNFSVLEIGPGDSLFSSLISHSLGATTCWLIDSGYYAMLNKENYHLMIKHLKDNDLTVLKTNIEPLSALEIVENCGGRYLVNGIESLSEIPTRSIDYCFSNAVLEHIPAKEFHRLAKELARVMKNQAIAVHRVDLKDHLGGSLNNLRFSKTVWESKIFSNSGFYTNRIRFQEMVSIFKNIGFNCRIPRIEKWNILPTPKSHLHQDFSSLTNDELLISGFDIVLQKKR